LAVGLVSGFLFEGVTHLLLTFSNDEIAAEFKSLNPEAQLAN